MKNRQLAVGRVQTDCGTTRDEHGREVIDWQEEYYGPGYLSYSRKWKQFLFEEEKTGRKHFLSMGNKRAIFWHLDHFKFATQPHMYIHRKAVNVTRTRVVAQLLGMKVEEVTNLFGEETGLI